MIISETKVAVSCKLFIIMPHEKCGQLHAKFWVSFDYENDSTRFVPFVDFWDSFEHAIDAVKSKSHLRIIDQIHLNDREVILVNDVKDNKGFTHVTLTKHDVCVEQL